MATLRSVDAWDHEVDVLIAGAGLAGCVAAIEAHDVDPGAEILIVEKMSERDHGGASRCAAQYMYCPPPEALEDLIDYQRALNLPRRIPETVLRAWGEAVVTNRPWIAEKARAAGSELKHRFDRAPDFPHLKGSESVREVWSIGVEGESGVWLTMRENVRQRGIEVLTETPIVDLIQDGDTLEVQGAIARQGDREIAIRARRGVVMCVGSFAANLEMQQEYCGHVEMYSIGCPANVGEGVRILQKAGAELWHLTGPGVVGGCVPSVKVDEFPSAFFRDLLKSNSWIDIAADGRRFYDETADYEATHFKSFHHGHWQDIPLARVLPIHMIFDEDTRTRSQLCLDYAGWNAVAEGYKWSADNTVELEKGWITKADSIRELAALIDRDPDELEATVTRYNAACEAGVDEEYGRSPERMQPIAAPPYYAMRIVPGIGQAPGGGVRDEQSRVIDHHGQPIPRLYEAGELGSTLANLYQNGGFLTEAVAFGRIAGRAVAQLAPQPEPQAV